VYRTHRRRRPLKVANILILVLAVALVAVTAVLFQTRSRLAGPAPGAAPAGEWVGANGQPIGAESARTSVAVGAGSTGVGAAVTSTFPSGAEGAPVAPAEGFLQVGQPGVDYTSAYVVERSTGRVLYAYDPHTPVPTASMAKMMTSLIVMEEIDAGRLSLEDPVTISARASRMGGSQIYAAENQVFTVETLLAATMVQSANDAATALAEKVAGSNEAFASLMNRRGRELGLEASTFYDPHGLPSRDGREDVMTARDLAVLGHELMRYPLMREYAETATMPFENATFTSGMTNPNRLLGRYDGVYGIKTGYTGSAGFSITAAARRGDMDVIAVLTGAKTSRGPQSSFELAGRLMDQAFLSWSSVAAVREGAPAGEAPVKGGSAPTVGAVAAGEASVLVPRGEEANVRWTFQAEQVEAPVAQGDTVGVIVVLDGEREVARVPAVAADAVEARPWWRFWGG